MELDEYCRSCWLERNDSCSWAYKISGRMTDVQLLQFLMSESMGWKGDSKTCCDRGRGWASMSLYKRHSLQIIHGPCAD